MLRAACFAPSTFIAELKRSAKKNPIYNMDAPSAIVADVFDRSRQRGISELTDYWLKGWRPKNPNQAEQAIASLISGLSEEEKLKLIPLIAHFIDASIFGVIRSLDSDDTGCQFTLNIHSPDGSVSTAISPEFDSDVLKRYINLNPVE